MTRAVLKVPDLLAHLGMEPLLKVQDDERSLFGPAWCGPDEFSIYVPAKVAEYAGAIEGHRTEVICTAAVSRFYTIKACGNPDVGEPGFMLSTGSSETEAAADIAQMISQGLLMGPAWVDRHLPLGKRAKKPIAVIGGRDAFRRVELVEIKAHDSWILLDAKPARGRRPEPGFQLAVGRKWRALGERLAVKISSGMLVLGE